MFEQMSETEQIIEKVVAGLQPEVLDSETAAQLVKRFATIERTAVWSSGDISGAVGPGFRGRSPNIVAATTWDVVGDAKLGWGEGLSLGREPGHVEN